MLDDLSFLVRRMVRTLRGRRRRAQHDEREVWEAIEKRLQAEDEPDQSPAFRRSLQALREALRRRLQVAIPGALSVRELRNRGRCSVTLTGDGCLASMGALEAVLIAATLASTVVTASFTHPAEAVAPTSSEASSGRSRPTLFLATTSLNSPLATPSSLSTRRRPVHLSRAASLPRATTLGADASADVKRDRRIRVEDQASGQVEKQSVHIAGGEIFWFDCDPDSTVRQTVCRSYDAVSSTEG